MVDAQDPPTRLSQAIAKVNKINKSDISELKCMRLPHPCIQSVAEALCLLFGIEPDTKMNEKTSKQESDWWAPCVKLMANPTELLQKIADYDKDNLSATVAAEVKKVAERPNF